MTISEPVDICANTISTLVLCESVLLREGIQALLRRAPDLDVVGEDPAGGASGVLGRLERARPRVVVLAAGGRAEPTAALVRRIRALPDAPQVIVLAETPPSREGCLAVMRSGASGFLLSDLEASALADAVRSVVRGGAAISPRVARLLLELLDDFDVDRMDRARSALRELSRRERDVLECLSQGMGNTQIGRSLFMSEGSVKAYISRLLAKLGCANRVQAAILWRDARLSPRSP
jgi:DNA-binding NarL/FixJ family response regulator